MKATRLLALLQEPHSINEEHIQALKELVEEYPYFQIAHSLLAKAFYDQSYPNKTDTLHTAAVYSPNRYYLKLLIKGLLVTPPAIDQAISTQSQLTLLPSLANDYLIDIKKRKRKTITNKKSLAQQNIIEHFIDQTLHISPLSKKNLEKDASNRDLSEDSTKIKEGIICESLAQIMIQQGKKEPALEIYNRLLLKFPEKSAYFVPIIDKLKKNDDVHHP